MLWISLQREAGKISYNVLIGWAAETGQLAQRQGRLRQPEMAAEIKNRKTLGALRPFSVIRFSKANIP